MYANRKDKNFETYLLIWLDASINSEENLDAQEKLRASIHYLQTFDKADECEKYILSVSSDDRIVLIVSGHLGQDLVPQIYQLRQISSIYIYCANQQFHQQWSSTYKKVKGVHNQLNELIIQIQSDQTGRRAYRIDEPLSILVCDSKMNYEESTTGLDGRFVQFQLLISCLSQLKTTSIDKNEFINKCREYYKTNQTQLKVVEEFANEYSSEYSLWWYTRDAFVYRLLNKALRVQNIDLLFLFRFFIHDIEKELHLRKHSSPTHVYRGQLMSKEEINVLKNSKGRLISTNSFLSTSSNLETAQLFLGSYVQDEFLERVLFEIDADPNLTGVKPFADVSKISQFSEDEVLMMLGSVFRLNNISFDDKYQYWHIHMTLCGDNDYDLQSVVYHMRKQYGLMNRRYFLFASVLIDMAHFDDAEKYLLRLLRKLPSNHKDIPKCYHALGKVFCEKGSYDLSLHYFSKALQFLQNSRSNESRIAYIYNNIGEVYQNMNDNKRALEAYEKAFSLFQKTSTDNDENLAWCYNNLGIIYEKENKSSQAHDYLLKAINIKTKVLPPQHPCLGNTYNNLGNVYFYLKHYDQALQQYELSYEIFQKSLKPFHPSLARTLRNIGLVYEVKNQYEQAKNNYEKVLDIRQTILSSQHPDFIQSKNDIERILSKIKE